MIKLNSEMIKIGINGLGRIGRTVLRALYNGYNKSDIQVVAVNDIGNINVIGHLLKYDSNYGEFPGKIEWDDTFLYLGSDKIRFVSESLIENILWGDLGVDIVLECTGVFTTKEKAGLHLNQGAKRVLVSAPCDGSDLTVVYGVNHHEFNPDEHFVLSSASCTTNCVAPVCKVLHDEFGIESAIMSTAHAYTNDQRILDLPHKDLRRARAAALSIIPTTTGAAKAVSKVMPDLKNKIDGLALRVPVPVVSVVDLVAKLSSSNLDKQKINEAFRSHSQKELSGILGVSEEPLVSVDFKGSKYSAVVDLDLTMVVGDLVKVVAWYDNEYAFSCRMLDCVKWMASRQ